MPIGSSSLNPRANLVEWSGSEAANAELGQGGYETYIYGGAGALAIGDGSSGYVGDGAIIGLTILSDNVKLLTFTRDEELPIDFDDIQNLTYVPVGTTLRGYWRAIVVVRVAPGDDVRLIVYKADREGR